MSSAIYSKTENPMYSTLAMLRAARIPETVPTTDVETIGQRIARLRKERGLTQKQLADKIGIIQVLVSDYEKGKLRLHAEMVVRFARALGVKTDEVLGLTGNAADKKTATPDIKIMRRLNRIAALPAGDQKIILKAIDSWLHASRGKMQ
jgi:transcriptional regulator with XRE-family HTH domain